MKESALQTACQKHLASLRARGEKIKWVKYWGGPMSKAGTPDLHITLNGVSIWAELKTATGVVSPLQVQEMKDWTYAGAVVGVVRSVSDLEALLVKAGRVS